MSNEKRDRELKNHDENASLRPDEETRHKTDPQEDMEGPVSSLMHKTGKSFDTKESKNEADNKRERNM